MRFLAVSKVLIIKGFEGFSAFVTKWCKKQKKRYNYLTHRDVNRNQS